MFLLHHLFLAQFREVHLVAHELAPLERRLPLREQNALLLKPFLLLIRRLLLLLLLMLLLSSCHPAAHCLPLEILFSLGVFRNLSLLLHFLDVLDLGAADLQAGSVFLLIRGLVLIVFIVGHRFLFLLVFNINTDSLSKYSYLFETEVLLPCSLGLLLLLLQLRLLLLFLLEEGGQVVLFVVLLGAHVCESTEYIAIFPD